MCESKSDVNNRVSNVLLYFCTCSWCYGGWNEDLDYLPKQNYSFVVYHKKHLLQSADSPSVPIRIKISSICVASDKMFRQNHDESLEYNQKQPLLINISSFQFLLHFLDHFFGWFIGGFNFLSLCYPFVLGIARWWIGSR